MSLIIDLEMNEDKSIGEKKDHVRFIPSKVNEINPNVRVFWQTHNRG